MNFFTALSPQFFISAIFFVVGVYISFYLPGRFIMGKIGKFRPSVFVLLSIVFGLVMWAFQAYIFGYFQARFLTYLYIITFIFLYLANYRKDFELLVKLKGGFRKNWVIILFLVIGTGMQLLPVAGSGLKYEDGVRFYGVNGTDGIMHLAYINSIIQKMPPVEPGAYPAKISNYHFWSDMVIADFARIWKIPQVNLFFQFFPLLISVFTGIASYLVIREIGGNRVAGVWSLFFLYFGGDATYLLMLFFKQVLSFDTPAIDNGVTQFLNMPNAMAKLVFLTSIIPLVYWIKTNRVGFGILTVGMLSSLVGLKIYYGIFAFLGLCFVIVIPFVKLFVAGSILKLKELKPHLNKIVLGLVFVILCALIYLPTNSNSGGLGYYPLEWPKIFLGPQVLNWGDWWLRMQVYTQDSNYKYLILFNTLAVIIGFICIHGTRMIGIFTSKKTLKTLGLSLFTFFVPPLIIFQILGMTTLQETGGYNVFNFFVVGAVVLSLLLSLTLSNFYFSKNMIKNSAIVILVLLTVPRALFEVSHYINKYRNPEGAYDLVSNYELEALNQIRTKTSRDVIVQSHHQNDFDKRTPYVSAFSERLTFLSGVLLQETHNHKLSVRTDELKHIFEADISHELVKRGKEKNIQYFYLRKGEDEDLLFNPDPNVLRTFFENEKIIILESVKK